MGRRFTLLHPAIGGGVIWRARDVVQSKTHSGERSGLGFVRLYVRVAQSAR